MHDFETILDREGSVAFDVPNNNISSFVGFAPADDPQIIAIAIIRHPKGVYYGGQIAAPVIRQLFENILPYLGIKEYNQE